MDERSALARLISERNEDFAGLSRLIGRNPAYIQQYIKRGTPRRLAEADRRRLARYFDVDEQMLGGPAPAEAALVRVPRIDLGVSAGPGALAGEEMASGSLAFDPAWLRRLVGGRPGQLSVVRVEGDSMLPTLGPGDDLLVDGSDGEARLRDGLYVLRRDQSLMVKRVSLHPGGRRLAVRSDNPAYPDWDCAIGELKIVGRAIWAGRRLT